MSLSAKLRMTWLLSYISLASVSAAIITPALPSIEQLFSLEAGVVEWIVSVFLVGYVIGQLIYGPLANCFGRLITGLGSAAGLTCTFMLINE